MSRIGKMPVPIPAGVEAEIDGVTVRVKGPKGSLTRRISPKMRVSIE
ncbi:MAG: 50S ribosomal protein L6, partial [Firmicutes bacterium]|nr:50S ribosomal protein L6 [Bacillota bacterium]